MHPFERAHEQHRAGEEIAGREDDHGLLRSHELAALGDIANAGKKPIATDAASSEADAIAGIVELGQANPSAIDALDGCIVSSGRDYTLAALDLDPRGVAAGADQLALAAGDKQRELTAVD